MRTAVLMTIWLMIAGAAAAQPVVSPSELRRLNDQLREDVDRLEAELAAARERIRTLEALVARLQEQLLDAETAADQRGEPAPADDLPPTDDDPTAAPNDADTTEPADPPLDLSRHPFAAPDALFESLKREYNASLASMPRETGEQVDRYIREVRRWANAVAFHRRSAVQWLVAVHSFDEVRPRVIECVMQVIHEPTGRPIGGEFHVTISGRDAIRILNEPDRALWMLSGTLAARPEVNPDRVERGVFNVPRLIGPYAEFDYTLTVRSLRPASSTDDGGSTPE